MISSINLCTLLSNVQKIDKDTFAGNKFKWTYSCNINKEIFICQQSKTA